MCIVLKKSTKRFNGGHLALNGPWIQGLGNVLCLKSSNRLIRERRRDKGKDQGAKTYMQNLSFNFKDAVSMQTELNAISTVGCAESFPQHIF